MKLLRFKYIKGEHQNLLDGTDLSFHSFNDLNKTTPICLAGINGSGKSKLLELIADVFYYLDRYSQNKIGLVDKTKLQFELEYIVINKRPVHVRVTQLKEDGYPVFETLTKSKAQEIADNRQISALLPKYIIGYSSGDNETLSKRFDDTYMKYAEDVTNLAINPTEGKVPNTRLIFLDYKVNSYVFIANSLFRSNIELLVISKKVERLHSLESFRITIQERPRYKGRHTRILLTPEL